MASYDTTTKTIVGSISEDADSVAGSIAKAINDYIQTIDSGKTIHGIDLAAKGHELIATIVHES